MVQAEAEGLYLVRSRNNETVKELYRRVVNIAKGAALMTGTTVDIEFDKACSNVVPSDTLGKLLYDTMVKIGVPEYTEEEKAYIMGFRRVIGDEAADHDLGMLPEFDLETRKSFAGRIRWVILSCRLNRRRLWRRRPPIWEM